MGGYYAGRYRSDAWLADGGGNDEYWDKYCAACGHVTDHDGSGCAECHNREIRQRSSVKSITVGNYTVKVYPNGTRYCSCKGFKFRKTCKHLLSA
jgi:hypothetical protein